MTVIPNAISTKGATKLVAGPYGATLTVEGLLTTSVGGLDLPVSGEIELPPGAVAYLFNEVPDAVETPEPAGF